MKGPGDNPQYGVKVDNKYDAIADCDDPFEAIDRLQIAPAAKDAAGDKSKPKSAGDKSGAASARKPADTKKDASKPQPVGAKQDVTAKKPASAQDKPKPAGEKAIPRADTAQQGQRRPRGGAAPRGGAYPQQAGVVGLTTGAPVEGGQQGDDENTANADGFQQQRFASSGNRGRRGGPRGGPYGGPASAGPSGGFRRPPYRGGFGGPRYPQAAPNAAGEEGETQPTGGALNESGEGEERLERNFERRGGARPFGGYRGGPGYARRGARRGAGAAGYFEDGTGRKREFERHSGSDVTGVRPVDKREGSGAHNWGTARDDLAGQTEAIAEGEQTEATATGEGAAAVTEAKAGEAWTDLVNADESAKAAEGDGGAGEQDAQYVLDDWKAREEKERFRVPEFNVRKANEGADSSTWGGFVLKKREGEEDDEVVIETDDAQLAADLDDAKRKAKQRLNIPVKFAGEQGYRGGRGGRGGARGGYERREGGEQRGEQRGGYDRPPRGGYDRPPRGAGAGGSGFRGGRPPAGGQAGAQLSMDDFPSLNKQAA